MKWIFFPALLFMASVSCQPKNEKTVTSSNAMDQQRHAGHTVIELFTSEGCSSCPAAEKYLGELSKDSNIILLSYHVDYWNRLGWVDSFSQKSFSDKQYKYGDVFKLSSVYTPQAVVNGKREAVGSNKNSIVKFIGEPYDSEQVFTALHATVAGNKVMVNAETKASRNDLLFEFLLVQKEAFTKVMGGENEGSGLHHKNVVRQAVEQTSLATANLNWLANFSKNNFQVVVLARDKNTYAVKDVMVKQL